MSKTEDSAQRQRHQGALHGIQTPIYNEFLDFGRPNPYKPTIDTGSTPTNVVSGCRESLLMGQVIRMYLKISSLGDWNRSLSCLYVGILYVFRSFRHTNARILAKIMAQ
jgi:hypothetical protein